MIRIAPVTKVAKPAELRNAPVTKTTKAIGRPRVHASAAQKQAAYRARKRAS